MKMNLPLLLLMNYHGEVSNMFKALPRKSFSVQLLTNLYASQNPNIISIIGANVLQNNMIAKGITKVQEQDADDIAFNYATSAGYNIWCWCCYLATFYR